MKLVGAFVSLVALVGCSKPATDAGSSQAAAPSVQSASASSPTGNACDRHLLTAADVSGLLSGNVTTGPLAGDPQTCVFTSDTGRLMVALRPGQGNLTVQTVLSGGENVDATPLAGVGDRAAWTSVLHEVNASKNNVLCDIRPGIANAGTATPEALGALCNKIFAAS